MAKLSLIQREAKREALVAKFAKKHAELSAIANDAKRSDADRFQIYEGNARRVFPRLDSALILKGQ